MNYFALEPECYLVLGSDEGALYDLRDGRIHPVERPLALLLEACEKGVSIDEAVPDDLSSERAWTWLTELEAGGMGQFCPCPVVIEKLKPPFLKSYYRMTDRVYPLRRLLVQLIADCNLECRFCTGAFP